MGGGKNKSISQILKKNCMTIGTDVAPGANLRTKNYSLLDMINMFNKNNSLGVADQVLYFFQTDISEGRDAGTISFEAGGGIGKPFSEVTSFIISKTLVGFKNIDKYIPLFEGKSIILAELNDINKFGTYVVEAIVEHPTETNFFVVTVTNIESSGVMAVDATYIFSEFARPIGNDDKTFVFTQAVPSATWSITHNLNKFPSVSVVDTANTQAFTIADYIDTNTLTLTFSAAFAGKAYLN
jgi:hypothetical protein